MVAAAFDAAKSGHWTANTLLGGFVHVQDKPEQHMSHLPTLEFPHIGWACAWMGRAAAMRMHAVIPFMQGLCCCIRIRHHIFQLHASLPIVSISDSWVRMFPAWRAGASTQYDCMRAPHSQPTPTHTDGGVPTIDDQCMYVPSVSGPHLAGGQH